MIFLLFHNKKFITLHFDDTEQNIIIELKRQGFTRM